MNEESKSITVEDVCFFMKITQCYILKKKKKKMLKHLLQETVIFWKVTEMLLQALLSEAQVTK